MLGTDLHIQKDIDRLPGRRSIRLISATLVMHRRLQEAGIRGLTRTTSTTIAGGTARHDKPWTVRVQRQQLWNSS